MVFEHIEKLKREYTDKYVVVDASRPELRRFEGQTGLIKTVNMNGHALVEFDGLKNIGWYDIGLDFLKVVDKPLPKEEEKKEAPKKKPAPKAKPAEAASPPAAKAGSEAKMSVAEMLAAARGEKGTGATTAEKPAEKKAAPAKPADGGKMSVADMLAAARAEKSGAAETETPEAAPADEPEPAVEPEAVAEEPEPAAPAGDVPKDTPGILAYCRRVDGG